MDATLENVLEIIRNKISVLEQECEETDSYTNKTLILARINELLKLSVLLVETV